MDCLAAFCGYATSSTRALLRAAEEGSAAAAAECIRQNPRLAVAVDWGRHTAWHRAAEAGHANVIEAMAAALMEGTGGGQEGGGGGGGGGGPSAAERARLLREGVSARDDCGLTPLMMACVYRRADCVAALARLGANPLDLDALGRGPLHYAALVDSSDCINALLSAYGGAGGPAPAEAHPEWAIPEPNTRATRLVDMQSLYGYTALHYAVFSDKMNAVRALASYEPSLTIQNTDVEPLIAVGLGNTPLHLAAFKGSFDMVKALLGIHVQTMSAGQAVAAAGPRQWGQQYTADVRHIRNRRGFMAYHIGVARHGDALTELLHPDVPYTFIFNNEDMSAGAVRMFGPPKLAVLAAGALQGKLLADLAAATEAAEKLAAAAEAAEKVAGPTEAAEKLSPAAEAAGKLGAAGPPGSNGEGEAPAAALAAAAAAPF